MSDFETWVRSELAVLADVVRPSADPYARLARRRRWSLFRRGSLLAGVAALAAAGAGMFVALAPAGAPEPRPTYEFSGRLHWVAGLVDAPPRGTVAQDPAFRDDLAARVERLSRTEPDDPIFEDDNHHPMGEVDAWVVFADDLADRRVAAVAMQRLNIADPARRYPATRLLWLAGTAGATPAQLLAGERQVSEALPATWAQFSAVWLLLAPGDCMVETSPVGDGCQLSRSPMGEVSTTQSPGASTSQPPPSRPENCSCIAGAASITSRSPCSSSSGVVPALPTSQSSRVTG
jgi:hypothetical protein